MQIINAEKHAARSAEARRRIARAAVLHESASTRTDGETAVILACARAYFWLFAGTGREASELFLAELCRHFNTTNVLAAAIEMCKTLPLGPKAFMKHACAQRARPGGCS